MTELSTISDLWAWLRLQVNAFTQLNATRLAADVREHVEEQNPYAVGGVATLVAVALALGVLFLWVASRQIRPRKTPLNSIKRPPSPTSKRLRHNSRHSKSLSDLVEAERMRIQETNFFEVDDHITFPQKVRQKCGPENLKFIYDTLSKVFSFLRGEFVEPLARELKIIHLNKGESIFNEGELDGSIWIIVNGSATLTIHGEKQDQRFPKVLTRGDTLTSSLPLLTILVNELQQGKCVAPMRKVCSNLSARAEEENTRLIKIPIKAIQHVLTKYPEAFFRLAQAALSQVEKITSKSLIDHFGLSSKIIQVVPLVSPEKLQHFGTTTPDIGIDCIADAIGLHDPDLRSKLASSVKVIKRSAKQTLRESNQEISALGVFVVINGSVSVQVATEPQEYTELYQGTIGCQIGLSTSFVGLHYHATRNVCLEDTTLLWIPDNLISKLLPLHSVAVRCTSHLLEQYSDLVCMADTSFDWLHLHSGESLFERGDRCDSVFTVISGRLRAVQVHSHRGKEVETTNEFVRGATLGAMDMLATGASNSSVFAIRDSQIAQMSRNVFDWVVSKYPSVLIHFTKNLARRLPTSRVDALKVDASGGKSRSNYLLSLGSNSTTIYGQKTRSSLPLGTVAVLSLTKMTKIQTFCSYLEQSLKTFAAVETISSQKAKAFLGDQWISGSRVARANLTAWMGDMESMNELVIYEADPHLTAWTKLCLRQADHILLLCSDTQPQQAFVSDMVSILEDAWDKRDAEINVVRIREQDWTLTALEAAAKLEVKGSSRSYALKKRLRLQMDGPLLPRFILPMEKYEWISGFHNVQVPFEEHHADFMRLSRRITGNAVGLVLGGGGARGLAHIGVLRALQECGIHVDVVGGTSIGAFIGGIYAMHPDNLDLVEVKVRQLSTRLSSNYEKLRDLTLPVASFFNGTRFNQSIRALFYDLSIEDLMLNFFCVSTDIAKSRMSIHRSGPVWKYVRASMSLQGYFPPISENGSLLVDGGYMNNLPADVMKEESGIKYIFAVDVASESLTNFYTYGSTLSGWWVLWNKLNPFAKTVAVPSMGDVSAALAYVSSEQHKDRIKEECVDLYLRPPVKDYGTLEFNKMEEIIDVGYKYALPRIKAWMARVLNAEPDADIKRTSPFELPAKLCTEKLAKE
ncbi:patatin like protein [Plasmopara halstedii]|uniref:Patatin like protein n=1 Tax=Plasmopara halstedii TaxID=4781 RepID=A0A0P1A8R6_PLAHL|nr:patatin like protein [Plasmopara halstedii]CEG36666.1 patatin like protein [Plasmopara halstedii]|eukprot:XP_024573035.1 patatin like protein [Plasmopara halstedii]